MPIFSCEAKARSRPNSLRRWRCWSCRTFLRSSSRRSARGMRRRRSIWRLLCTVCCETPASRACSNESPGPRCRGGGAEADVESRELPSAPDPDRGAAGRLAVARGDRGRAAVAPACAGRGRRGISRGRLRSGDGLLAPGPGVGGCRGAGAGLAAVGRGPETIRDDCA